MKRANLFLLILCCILLNHAANAALTATTTIANCNQQGSISLSSTLGAVNSFSYAGTSAGMVTGSTVNLNCGTYSVTATLSSGSTETATNIIVDHEDHIQLKNWYLTGNIPSISVNWGAAINNPRMTGWTGITSSNGCISGISLEFKSIIGSIPNFNLPNLYNLDLYANHLNGNIPNFNLPYLVFLDLSYNQLSGTIPNFNLPSLSNLYLSYNQLTGTIPNFNLPNLLSLHLENNQLSGCIPSGIRTNCPSIVDGNISNNPNLSSQSWTNYWKYQLGSCSPTPFILGAKVFLSGVSNSGLMNDYLRYYNFPTTDPYSNIPLNNKFIHVNNPTVAQIQGNALAVDNDNAIVDWVFLELRQGTSNSTSVVYTKSALLQKDGDIVATDGSSPVVFNNATTGNYYVAVRHRNHLGFRTANKITIGSNPVILDFTNNSVPLFGATPLTKVTPTIYSMNGGDANSDGSIDAFDTILWEIQNGVFGNYFSNADYDLDASVDALDTIPWELNNGKFQELD